MIRSIHPLFNSLPFQVREETLTLIDTVNQRHLHCEDSQVWSKVHFLITGFFATRYLEKQKKGGPATSNPVMTPLQDDQGTPVPRRFTTIRLSRKNHEELHACIKKELETIFHDTAFTTPVLEAFQEHIMAPLASNAELIKLLCVWTHCNAMYLPLGTHLLDAYLQDMQITSPFAEYVLKDKLALSNASFIFEAVSQDTIARMRAFLAEAAQAHCDSCVPMPPRTDQPTAVMLSVKHGAGGHTAPAAAMASRLKERGWRVETFHYDTDISSDSDPMVVLGVTFEDGTPMTKPLYHVRWKAQKHCKEISLIVDYYVAARISLDPDLFVDEEGGVLLRERILPLNPQLLITTCAYHWSWQSTAYRVPTAKTLLVASDVFIHFKALSPWYRQQSLPPKLRQIHFTTMTDDHELLISKAVHHDRYFVEKFSREPTEPWKHTFSGFHLDDQVSVIGAPIHPAFDAITNKKEIDRLRKKWDIPEGALSICISRGKLGFESDLKPALECYRTEKLLSRPVVLHVVCGENQYFYEKLQGGEYSNLGPNITVIPHPLLKPQDFAELRAISTLDDIKAGGGSTFEGWFLISKGIQSMLLLTPGPTLWWERSNCEAMEKWGIGRTVSDVTSRIPIIGEIQEFGLPAIKNRFPDWKEPFDRTVDALQWL